MEFYGDLFSGNQGHFRNGADAFLLAHPLFSSFSSLAFSLYLGENNSKLMVAILICPFQNWKSDHNDRQNSDSEFYNHVTYSFFALSFNAFQAVLASVRQFTPSG